jgi:asparagine synthase (glutamine-hydrolysing)
MCGIAGIFHFCNGDPVDENVLRRVLQSMRYRGPDHLGLFFDRDLGLGNVRLSIIGIDAAGNQPLSNEDGQIVVVYNGEIYNFPELRAELIARGHVFRSTTDTEVLVHLYEEEGPDLVQRLNGMFALALFDRRTRTLLLARDRAGQKPLYVQQNSRGVFFASELRAMVPHLENRQLDPVAVRTFLSLGYTLEPTTLFAGVQALEPGCVMTLGAGGVRRFRYWPTESKGEGARPVVSPVISDMHEWLAAAQDIFPRAISRHLLSDVPMTLFLSGGIDSSLLACFLARLGKIKRAYTGSFVDVPDHDEFPFAERLARHFGLKIERVDLSCSELARHCEAFLGSASQPQGDASGLPTYCLARAVSRDFRVVLGGDGGDELFGGYPTYTLPFRQARLKALPTSGIALAHRLAAAVGSHSGYLSWPLQLQQLGLAWGKPLVPAHFALKNFLPAPLARAILADPADAGFPDDTPKLFSRSGSGDFVAEPTKYLQWLDFETFLRSGTIPKMERNCMIHSLENRLPFLDDELIELSRATHPRLMVDGTQTKCCLKALLRSILPAGLSLNPNKQGFYPPLRALFAGPLRDWRQYRLSRPTPFLKNGWQSALEHWRRRGWDLQRLEWHIFALADWLERNAPGTEGTV